MAIINTKSVGEIENTRDILDNLKDTYKLNRLVDKILSDFEKAKVAKQPITDRIIKALYYMRNSYPPEKLAKINEIGGSTVFIPIVNIKVRACKAWLSDIYFSSPSIFSLSTTEIPDLPDNLEAEILEDLFKEMVDVYLMAQQMSMTTGSEDIIDSVVESFNSQREKLKEEYLKKLKEEADSKAKLEEKRIRDQFEEGGFYTALDAVLSDIALFPSAIMKGPILVNDKVFVAANKKVEDVAKLIYKRVHPLDIFPAPYSSSPKDGYIIEILHMTPQDLYNLIDVEGFNKEAILRFLGSYSGGRIAVGNETYDSVRKSLEGRSFDADVIDVIEYWGSVKGEILMESGVNLEEVTDEEAYYDVAVWIAGDEIIKAMLNPYPLGRKPYSVASFVEVPDSFWGMSVCDVLEQIQEAVNALARSAVNNSIMSSGALIERNIDRISGNSSKEIAPFQIFDAHESAMNSAPAFRFYQLQPVAQQIILLMQHFQKMADEYSGIPAYAHGDITVGGAGRTASGLSMLQLNASRGIKDVIKNIDTKIIQDMVERQYYYNLCYIISYPHEVPDLNIKAKGLDTLTEKQTQATKMLEFLQLTSNPVDMQLVGLEGRRYMLENIAKNIGIDVDKVFASNMELQAMASPLLQQMYGATSQMPAPTEVAPLGAQAQELGRNVNQFEEESGNR